MVKKKLQCITWNQIANKHISIDENDFKTLVSGGVVEQDGVKIILKDIGWTEILKITSEQWDRWVNKMQNKYS